MRGGVVGAEQVRPEIRGAVSPHGMHVVAAAESVVELEDEVAAFLKSGGKIQQINTGKSGFTQSNPYKPNKNIVLS